MASICFWLRTKKGGGRVKIGRVKTLGDTAVEHELPKGAFVGGPVPGVAIRGANFRRGSEARLVGISYSGNAVQEEGEIGIFGESGELANSIFANIDQLLNACVLQQREKLFSGFPSKPN